MKFHFFTFIAFLFLTACSVGDPQLSAKQEDLIHDEIKSEFDKLAKAAETLNHESYFSFFDESGFSVLNADGTTLSTFEAFKNSYLPQLRHIKQYNSLVFNPVRISVVDAQNAILLNEYSAEIVLKSGEVISASGAGAQFWSRRTGEWKLVHVSDAMK